MIEVINGDYEFRLYLICRRSKGFRVSGESRMFQFLCWWLGRLGRVVITPLYISFHFLFHYPYITPI